MIAAITTIPASPGLGYDGVLRVIVDGYYGTGVLLHDGRAILTAAHLFENEGSQATVQFNTTVGEQFLSATSLLIHPDYDSVNCNHDLALIWLATPAPLSAERYTIYRDSDEIGQVMTMVGYGLTGTGSSGTIELNSQPTRNMAVNRIEADASALSNLDGMQLSWEPAPGTQFISDFDNGQTANDALGVLLGLNDTGEGIREGLIAPGDSGGPAFIDQKITGIASYTTSLSSFSRDPDIDSSLNSSFGEIGAWQRVSSYQQWIDQSMRAMYADAPTTPAEVKRSVQEMDSGTSFANFLLQFDGVRETPDQILEVDFATRDGSARMGEDYLTVNGTLKLYPNENQVVIPVEIIGDTRNEANEFFFMDVFIPDSDSPGEDTITLTAIRTIIDDDFA